MQKVRVPVTNFQFGEISPSLISRTDTQVYTKSAQKLENFFIRAEGGVIKRAGLKNLYEFDTTVEATSFTITVSDYANIATGSKLQFYKDDGTLITIQFVFYFFTFFLYSHISRCKFWIIKYSYYIIFIETHFSHNYALPTL